MDNPRHHLFLIFIIMTCLISFGFPDVQLFCFIWFISTSIFLVLYFIVVFIEERWGNVVDMFDEGKK